MKKYIILSFFLLLVNLVIGQHQCHNDIDWEQTFYVQQLLEQHTDKNYTGQTPMVRLALHNVRKKDGTGGNTWSDIRNVVQGISAFYNPHNICFTVISEDNIDNDTYFNLKRFGNPTWEDLITKNRINNAINIYFVKDAASGGRSTGSLFGDNFPTATLSNSLTGNDNVTRFTFDAAVLAHELGHCLGLFHTHQQTEVSGVMVKEEILRTGVSANCTTIGDLLCDTPADPGLGISAANVGEISCNYIGGSTFNGSSYAPDTRNVMSYTLPDCMQWFTTGQGNRMRNLILNSNTLDDFVIRENITLTGTINDDSYFGVENTIISSATHIAADITYEAANSVILEEGFSISAYSPNTTLYAHIGTYNCLNPLIHNQGKIVKGDDSEIPTNEIITDKSTSISSGKIAKELFNKPFAVNPNPFTNTFNIEFELETEGETSLIIYDALGRVVETVIVNTTLSIGKHQYQIDGTKLESGLYYATLQTANGTQTIKILKQ